jgi:hypothetical protein
VQEFVKNVEIAAASLPVEERITSPLRDIISPKAAYVPFEVPKNLFKELTPQEKAAKEKLENPTVDENGEHIQTVAEARLEA